MTDVVEIMARGMFRAEAWSSFWSEDDAKTLVRASLTALESAGWCVVPREPTEEMKEAHRRAFHDLGEIATNQWKAAISSAPKPGE